MSTYTVSVRILNDEPDAKGYVSSGIELPMFSVDAISHGNARAIARDIVKGWTHTRIMMTTCDFDGEAASADSHMFYAPGWNAERVADLNTIRVAWHFAENGRWIDGNPFPEEDADSVTLFGPDGFNVLSMCKTSRGNWRIDSSDMGHRFKPSWYDLRKGSASELADFVAAKLGTTFERVDSFDDEPAHV